MTDQLKRALRTFVQGAIATLALLAIPILTNITTSVAGGGNAEIDTNLWGNIVIAVCAGGLAALISWAQNAIEEKTGTNILPK